MILIQNIIYEQSLRGLNPIFKYEYLWFNYLQYDL